MVSTSPENTATLRAGAPAAARIRDPRLDFYRGIAMIIILFAHTPGNFFTSWIPARWGFSDATEIFVFCSGMASSIAFGRTFDRAGWLLGAARVAFRVWQVYWAHIAMFFTIATILAAIDTYGDVEKVYVNTLNLSKFFAEPGPQLVGLFTLTYVPNYFDILPMYLAILVMMPLVVVLGRVSPWVAGAAVISVWGVAQGGLMEALGIGHLAINFPAEPWSDREWFFNPFAWQLIFFTGFAFMRGWIPAPPVSGLLIVLAAIVVLATVPLSSIGVREFGFDWARDWRRENTAWFSKSDFGILRYTHFLALAYLAWVAAGIHGHRLRPGGHDALARNWRGVVNVIMKIGQQSLAVFVFSMVFARIVGFVLDQVERSTLKVVVANLVGVTALIAVAYFVGWVRSQPWRSATGRG